MGFFADRPVWVPIFAFYTGMCIGIGTGMGTDILADSEEEIFGLDVRVHYAALRVQKMQALQAHADTRADRQTSMYTYI